MYENNGKYFNLIKLNTDNHEEEKEEQSSQCKIPKNVFLTWKTLSLPNQMRKNVDKLIEQHPDFTIRVFDDDMCRQFISKHFPEEVLHAFNTLVPGAYKADLWRLCALYIHGGIYLDIKYGCVGDFRLNELLYDEHLALDRPVRPGYWASPEHYGIYNAVMICLPNTEFLRKAIYAIVWNVQNKVYGYNFLYPTGPGLLGQVYATCLEKPQIDMAMVSVGMNRYGENCAVIYKNKMVLETYKEYRIELHNTTKMSYVQMYKTRSIYATQSK